MKPQVGDLIEWRPVWPGPMKDWPTRQGIVVEVRREPGWRWWRRYYLVGHRTGREPHAIVGPGNAKQVRRIA